MIVLNFTTKAGLIFWLNDFTDVDDVDYDNDNEFFFIFKSRA